MRAVGWSNGAPNNQTGAGYGIRVSRSDRERYFDATWPSVRLHIEEEIEASIDISPSFWKCCVELRSQMIGKWMLDRNLAPWPKREPPAFEMEPIGPATFTLRAFSTE